MRDSSSTSSTSSVGLQDLVQPAPIIDVDHPVAEARAVLAEAGREYGVVVDGERVVGLCRRSQLDGETETGAPVRRLLVDRYLSFTPGTPLPVVADAVTSGPTPLFEQDVVVVDRDQRCLGIVEVRRLLGSLVESQTRLVQDLRTELRTASHGFARSRSEQQARERQVIQQEKNAAVQTLLGGIAHEISNRLMPILGYSEMMLESDGLTTEFRTHCEAVHSGASEVARIIRQLLQLSRPTAPELTRVDFRGVVTETLLLMKAQLDESGTVLDLDIPTGEVPIQIDATQIKQVIVNLVGNALDAMNGLNQADGAGDKHLTVRLRHADGVARLAVSDQGPGIAADVVGRIFDPFFTTKGPDRGTGLGLTVSRAIVEQHGGVMHLDAEPGTDTTFYVEFPVATNRRAGAGDVDATESPAEDFSRISVLVVEDDAPTARVIQRALETRLGCRVEVVEDGERVVGVLKHQSYSAIVACARMPNMNAPLLLAWLGSHRPDLLSHVVFTTGDVISSSLNLHVAKMGVPLLQKPFTLEQLESQIRRILTGRSGDRPSLSLTA